MRLSLITRSLVLAAALTSTVLSSQAQAQPKQRPSGGAANEARPQDVTRVSQNTRGGQLNWDAFLDVEARWPNRNDLDDRGFSVNDGALYVSKDISKGSILLDLPFYSTLSNSDNNFSFATRRAQAVVAFTFGSVVTKLGQYDTFLGIEPNDSRDRFFANGGIIESYLLPQTHTGFQAAFQSDQFILRGQITDPSVAGNSSNTMDNTNPEFGVQAQANMGGGYGALGLTLNEGKNATGNSQNMIVDVKGGGVFDKFRLDAEFLLTKVQLVDKTGNTFGVYGSYLYDDALSFGGRVEFGKDVTIAIAPGPGTLDSVTHFAAGPSYRLDQDLTVRGDFSFLDVKPPVGDSTTIFGLTISMVATL